MLVYIYCSRHPSSINDGGSGQHANSSNTTNLAASGGIIPTIECSSSARTPACDNYLAKARGDDEEPESGVL